MNMLDGNTHALNDYLFSQEASERAFELSKTEKCDNIVDYSLKLLKGEVSKDEFQWAFSQYYDEESETMSTSFLDALDGLAYDVLLNVALVALESSSELLYDIELSEVAIYEGGYDHTLQMVDELVIMFLKEIV